jgi:sugar phosphate isomerase/epimerase
MNDLKIAVFPQQLSDDWYEGLRLAADLDVQGVHLPLSGPWGLEQMDTAACRELLNLLKSYGLVVSAVSWGIGELPHREEHATLLPQGQRALQIAADLECGLWQAHCGVLPWEESDPGWSAVIDSAGELAAYGEQVGAALVWETGPEPSRVLLRVMETVDSPALGVNLDPANLIIWPVILAEMSGQPWTRAWADANFEPHEAAALLAPWVRHTHAKDALVQEDGSYLEVPLGEGWVCWTRYVGILRQAGFDGFFAIEREVGTDRLGDTIRAIDFLRNLPV